MKRDDRYQNLMGKLALGYTGEHKGAQATARALMDSPEALHGAHAVAHLVGQFQGAAIEEGLDEHRAAMHALALLALIEMTVGNLIDNDAANRFGYDYTRAAEAIGGPTL